MFRRVDFLKMSQYKFENNMKKYWNFKNQMIFAKRRIVRVHNPTYLIYINVTFSCFLILTFLSRLKFLGQKILNKFERVVSHHLIWRTSRLLWQTKNLLEYISNTKVTILKINYVRFMINFWLCQKSFSLRSFLANCIYIKNE